MKRILGLLLCFVFSVVLFACGGASEYDEMMKEINSVARENQFIVGLECAYQPFNWTEDKKTETNYPISNIDSKFAEGYDIQIAKKIANKLGKTLVIKAVDWDA